MSVIFVKYCYCFFFQAGLDTTQAPIIDRNDQNGKNIVHIPHIDFIKEVNRIILDSMGNIPKVVNITDSLFSPIPHDDIHSTNKSMVVNNEALTDSNDIKHQELNRSVDNRTLEKQDHEELSYDNGTSESRPSNDSVDKKVLYSICFV